MTVKIKTVADAIKAVDMIEKYAADFANANAELAARVNGNRPLEKLERSSQLIRRWSDGLRAWIMEREADQSTINDLRMAVKRQPDT